MRVALTNATLNKWLTYGPGRIVRFVGWNNQATNLYIQFHDASTMSASGVISNGDVPSWKSYLAQPNNGFDYQEGIWSAGPLVVGVSTTETSYTAPAANGGLDWTIEVDSNYDATAFTAAANIVGDLTTGVDSLQLWADSSPGAHRLLRIDYANKDGANRILLGVADTAAAQGEGQFASPQVANGVTYVGLFGPGGRVFISRDDAVVQGTITAPTGGAAHYGATLEQTTAGTVATGTSSSVSNIRAFII